MRKCFGKNTVMFLEKHCDVREKTSRCFFYTFRMEKLLRVLASVSGYVEPENQAPALFACRPCRQGKFRHVFRSLFLKILPFFRSFVINRVSSPTI